MASARGFQSARVLMSGNVRDELRVTGSTAGQTVEVRTDNNTKAGPNRGRSNSIFMGD
jgi:hypothetical protein